MNIKTETADMIQSQAKDKSFWSRIFFWTKLSPINQRRWNNFKANKRGYWSLWIFLTLFIISLFAEFIANDRPLLIKYDGGYYTPILKTYTETQFGGEFQTEAKYREQFVKDLIKEKGGWIIWPLIEFDYNTQLEDPARPSPSRPTSENLLGTDDIGRDVLARVIYGFRLSAIFGLVLTLLSSIIGITAGAIQGYFGGRIDLYAQRFIELWTSLPQLFILLIFAQLFEPGFFLLLGILLLFSWTALVGVVRAEFLRGRNFDYIKAARALGLSDTKIMFKHLLPNAMVATITMVPFILSGSLATLTALDYLGLGLPPGQPSLGELLKQGKENLHAWWLMTTGFLIISIMLSLLVFIGEAARDALDPRKTFQ